MRTEQRDYESYSFEDKKGILPDLFELAGAAMVIPCAVYERVAHYGKRAINRISETFKGLEEELFKGD